MVQAATTQPRRRTLATVWLSAVSLPRLAFGRPSGLFLVGGSNGEPEPAASLPALDFETSSGGSVILAPALDANGGTLQLLRGGMPEVTLGSQVASLPHTFSASGIAMDTLTVQDEPQWALWNLDSFDMAGTGIWSTNERSSCGASSDQFLGGPCRFGATSTMRRYENLPPHSRVKVSARVHYFDDWRGEHVAMQVDGSTMWAQAHEWCPGFLTWMCVKFGLNTCGRDTPDRLSVKAEAILPHSASVLDVAFASSIALGSDPCHASWGVDDVAVELL